MSTKAWDRGTRPSAWGGLFGGGRRRTGLFDRFLRDHQRPAGVLWDMDGLLVDSEPLWTIAEHELFADWGLEFTPTMKAAVVGGRLDTSVPKLISFGGAAAAGSDVAAIQRRLLDRMCALFAADIPLRPGARNLLTELDEAGIPQALVSSSYRVLVDAVLAGLPLNPFAFSVAGDEVERCKPDPEPYRRAATSLGVDSAACIVLEDTPIGCLAGRAAGARVVYCPSVAGAGAPEPDWRYVKTLEVVSYGWLRNWPATDAKP